jgi:cytochrome oxidase Cu insertion factor (SCO1/SenC/PrrC family)
MLGAQQASSVDLVAVVANPIYRSLALTNAFDDQEGLDKVHNWTFLTGTRAELETVWGDYGVDALVEPGGAMVDHSDIVFLIDGHGRIREIFNADPGDGTSVDQSSFSALLAGQVKRFAHS